MPKTSYYLINGITIYRLVAAPLLVALIFNRNIELFKWLLAVSFFTDLIDGYLARKFKVASILGAKLDSIADDLTIFAGITGLLVLKPFFMSKEILFFIIMLGLFVLQTGFAFIKYHKMTSFHTYLAKFAAILQGTFLILVFFLPEPVYFLFYATVIVTSAELVEEIILVSILPRWEANVKGLFWVMKR